MTKAYSLDLRERIIRAVGGGALGVRGGSHFLCQSFLGD